MKATHYRLDEINVSVSTHRKPYAEVTVFHERQNTAERAGATGDGPVDALYRAINNAVGRPHELINYKIESISQGADAVGEVTVLVKDAGSYFKGIARHTDILYASAGAYLDALNHLETFRTGHEASTEFVLAGIMDSFQQGIA